MKPKVIVICGPTASGKTALSVELAKRINGQIVSADSMQIYKYMNIGTAKPNKEEMQGIKHYMIDIIEPNKRYSVAQYKYDAKKAIKQILENGKFPIVVGGTGLYINSLIYEIEYTQIKFDEKYREQLEKQVENEGLQKLYEKAIQIDPKAMEQISKNDKKRILRVLEIYNQTGITKTMLQKESRKNEPEYEYIVYGLDMPRQLLYDRINKRVDLMIQNGLIEEVQNIIKKYNKFPTAMQGLGYKEVVNYLKGNITKEQMLQTLKMQTRRYAKRQLTWFRKNKEIIWIKAPINKEEMEKTLLQIK